MTKAIVFGKTGSGKSTLCNMLIAGHPKPKGGFDTSGGIRGQTSAVAKKKGRGWHVTDTIGMGETADGTVGTEEARKKLMKFLKNAREDSMEYIIYVARKGRFTEEEEFVWEAFKKIFKGGESNFVVVYTHTTQKWIAEEKDILQTAYKGHNNRFIGVDFPPEEEDEDDAAAIEVLKNKWDKNLKILEETLRHYSLDPVQPDICAMNDAQLQRRAGRILHELGEIIRTIFQRSAEFINPEKIGKALDFIFGLLFKFL